MAKRGTDNKLDSAGDMAESLAPTFDSFMATAKPILKEGKKIAKQKAKQAKRAAKAATKALSAPAVVPEKKGNKVKKLLLLAGLVGLASVIVRRLMGAPSRSNWQPAYTPAPAPAPAPRAAAAEPEAQPEPQPEPEPEPDDAAGSSPDEALADQADAGPHPDTTPDEPAEVVELADYAEPRKPDPLTDPLPDPLTDPLPPEPADDAPAEPTKPPAKRAKKAAKPPEE